MDVVNTSTNRRGQTILNVHFQVDAHLQNHPCQRVPHLDHQHYCLEPILQMAHMLCPRDQVFKLVYLCLILQHEVQHVGGPHVVHGTKHIWSIVFTNLGYGVRTNLLNEHL
jgi:hypothetical protein